MAIEAVLLPVWSITQHLHLCHWPRSRYTIGNPKNNIGVLSNKGYIVEATDLIYVSVRVNAGFNPGNGGSFAHAGGLVSKGNSALGKIFRLGAMLNPLLTAAYSISPPFYPLKTEPK
jgi:hypothetical protein